MFKFCLKIEYQQDKLPPSNVLGIPVGQEEPAGQNPATLLETSRQDQEYNGYADVDVADEQDPVSVNQDYVEDGTGHVESSQGRMYDEYAEVDNAAEEQAPVEDAKEDVAVEFTGTYTSQKVQGNDDNAEVDVASGKAVAGYVPVVSERQISLDTPENLPVQGV